MINEHGGLEEIVVAKAEVGTLRITFDVPPGEEAKINMFVVGEYETPTGEIHALTKKKAFGIMKIAKTVEQALMIVHDDRPEGAEWQ